MGRLALINVDFDSYEKIPRFAAWNSLADYLSDPALGQLDLTVLSVSFKTILFAYKQHNDSSAVETL